MATLSGLFTRLMALFRQPDPVPVGSGVVNPLSRGLPASPAPPVIPMYPLAWGRLVDDAFRQRVREIAYKLRWDANWLMDIMAFESAKTFSPSIRNAAGSGAVGLIQIIKNVAIGLGTTLDQLAAMTALKQLDYVEKYLLPYSLRVHSLEDAYMAVLYPKAIGKPNDFVLFADDPVGHRAYFENRGLDYNADHKITKTEATQRVGELLIEGLKPENIA